MELIEEIKTDVLVVGGGAAACMAAISAKNQGAKVLMLDKGQVGKSGCSPNAHGGMAIYHKSEHDNWRVHAEDTLMSGGFLNDQALVKILCQEGQKFSRILERFGSIFSRDEDGTLSVRKEDQELEVRVPGRLPLLPALAEVEQKSLTTLGFVNSQAENRMESWVCPVDSANAAVSMAERVLQNVFGQKPETALDVVHGNHRAAHEARVKLTALRERVEQLITESMGKKPARDRDQDSVLPIGDVQVTVAPRVIPGAPAMVRIFAITNVGVATVPELGLQLARLNFGLMFGRFALDVEHAAIWFDETLLGDQLGAEELNFAIQMIATTADEWDDRLKQMFGGTKFRDFVTENQETEPTVNKPGDAHNYGHGLYL